MYVAAFYQNNKWMNFYVGDDPDELFAKIKATVARSVPGAENYCVYDRLTGVVVRCANWGENGNENPYA